MEKRSRESCLASTTQSIALPRSEGSSFLYGFQSAIFAAAADFSCCHWSRIMVSGFFLKASLVVTSPKLCSFLVMRRASSCLSNVRQFSVRSALEPPDIPLLAETARITLSPQEVEDIAPKIRQVIDWMKSFYALEHCLCSRKLCEDAAAHRYICQKFGQLEAVYLESIKPALRADTEVGENFRTDSPELFENREAILASIPSFEEPFIKVPKILNKE